MSTWLDGLQKLPVTFTGVPRAPMHKPILGVVLHTTNTGSRKLEEYQWAWQALQHQGAHFMVARNGNVAQFRTLEEGIGHMGGGFNNRYYGIEHIAMHKEELTNDQILASAELIVTLHERFRFVLNPISKAGEFGIGFHKQFNSTGCGEAVFCKTGHVEHERTIDLALPTFGKIIDKAKDIKASRQKWGF